MSPKKKRSVTRRRSPGKRSVTRRRSPGKRSVTRRRSPGKRSPGKRPLNPYFKRMLAAKKSGASSFTYNNNTYVGRKHKTLLIYKKAGRSARKSAKRKSAKRKSAKRKSAKRSTKRKSARRSATMRSAKRRRRTN